MESTDNVVNKD